VVVGDRLATIKHINCWGRWSLKLHIWQFHTGHCNWYIMVQVSFMRLDLNLWHN
jgi:hypothetical protein